MPRKAVALFSGGLDSTLAVCLMKEQNIEVIAYHLVSLYCKSTIEGKVHPDIITSAEELGVELHWEDSTLDMIKMVNSPRWGFGKNRNPCIDCHLNVIIRADQYRRKIGADFMFSGEVLGQRPMSQNRRAFGIIDSNSNLSDILLRPLSARFLDPTLPEREGWVDREKLPLIRGRGRKPQIEMAKQFGVTKFSAPAGGCLLTDRNYCNRLDDLMKYNQIIEPDDLRLLRIGRHIRISPGMKVITGRNNEDNLVLGEIARAGDIIFQTIENRGSLILLCPDKDFTEKENQPALADEIGDLQLTDDSLWKVAAGLAVYFSRNRDTGHADVEVRKPGVPWGGGRRIPRVAAIDPKTLEIL